MLRRTLLAAALVVLAACSNCGSATCKEGITFLVADVAGSLARGSSEPLQICFDGQCQSTTITRSNAGGTVFLPFKGVGKTGDHTLTVTGTGSLKGQYKGPIDSYTQKPNGKSCPGACALASVKIGADGTITPGRTVPPTTTTAQSPTTSAAQSSSTTGG